MEQNTILEKIYPILPSNLAITYTYGSNVDDECDYQ